MNQTTEPEDQSCTCPVCTGTEFSREHTGFLVKKIQYCCRRCQTLFRQAGTAGSFRVVQIGREYSNCARLFQGLDLGLDEPPTDGLPIHSDEALAILAKGEIPESFFASDDPAGLPAALHPGERSILLLDNLYRFEDRVLRSAKASTRSIQTLVGRWGEIPVLPEPRYQNVVETLDRGALWITTDRYRFTGEENCIEEPLAKVKSVLLYRDGLGMTRTNSPRFEYYKGGVHWPLVSALLRGLVHNATPK